MNALAILKDLLVDECEIRLTPSSEHGIYTIGLDIISYEEGTGWGIGLCFLFWSLVFWWD